MWRDRIARATPTHETHGDHVDHVVAERLDKQIPIVTNPAATEGLRDFGFERPLALGLWESLDGRKGDTTLRVTATPGRHGPVAVAWTLVAPRFAIPIHYDDYGVFKSPLADFVEAVRAAGLESRVRVLERGERHAIAAPATTARR